MQTRTGWWTGALACLGVIAIAPSAGAQEREVEVVEVEAAEVETHDGRPDMFFVEATGAYGVQFGETDYLPAGAVGDWQHPIVHGYSVGATAGFMIMPSMALIAEYDYTSAQSRTGRIDGLLDEVQGEIDYHTITAGARFFVPLPYGSFQAELGAGVVLPFETELRFQYAPTLAPVGISGTGTRIDEYSVGFGAHALFGYLIPIGDVFYSSLNVKFRTFESENSGERTRLTNFVTDFEGQPPTATTGEVRYGDGAARPSTNSVQDVRLQIALGARF